MTTGPIGVDVLRRLAARIAPVEHCATVHRDQDHVTCVALSSAMSAIIKLLVGRSHWWSAMKRMRLASTVLTVFVIAVIAFLYTILELDVLAAGETDQAAPGTAAAALAQLEVKGRAPMTGYDRELFGPAWKDIDRNGCDQRNDILARDLVDETFREGPQGCIVVSGVLHDKYTGMTIHFQRGQGTSEKVQIDHVVPLANAWQTGAQGWSAAKREQFANDPLNLMATDGPTNQAKGAGDAATWLPPNRTFWCPYVARQIAVKAKYDLWVTPAEKDAMQRVLDSCPGEPLPSS